MKTMNKEELLEEIMQFLSHNAGSDLAIYAKKILGTEVIYNDDENEFDVDIE